MLAADKFERPLITTGAPTNPAVAPTSMYEQNGSFNYPEAVCANQAFTCSLRFL